MHEISILTIIKNLGYIPAIFIGLSVESYAVLAIFMVFDTILGIARTYIVHGGKEISSARLTSGIISKLSIILIPLLMAWGGRGAGVDLAMIAQATLGMLILAELYSILGNIYAIRLREDVYEFDAVSWVLRRVQLGVERLLKGDEKKNYQSQLCALKEKKTKK